MFRGLSDEVLNAICKAVVPMLAVKDRENDPRFADEPFDSGRSFDHCELIAAPLVFSESIIREGDIGSEMYMLMKGEVEMRQKGARLGFLGEGAFFGEIPVLADGDGSETRVRTVRAVTACELCFLTRASAKELVRHCLCLVFQLPSLLRLCLSLRSSAFPVPRA